MAFKLNPIKTKMSYSEIFVLWLFSKAMSFASIFFAHNSGFIQLIENINK